MTASTVRLAVCGLHLRGQPLNWQLTDLNSSFVKECSSAPVYKLYAITDDSGRIKPGMVRHMPDSTCRSILLELWDVPIEKFGKFMLQVPPPLGIGTVDLIDGSQVKGFICEAWVAEAAKAENAAIIDITDFGGWSKFVEGESHPRTNFQRPKRSARTNSNAKKSTEKDRDSSRTITL